MLWSYNTDFVKLGIQVFITFYNTDFVVDFFFFFTPLDGNTYLFVLHTEP